MQQGDHTDFPAPVSRLTDGQGMTTSTTTWATLEDAATALDCSVRTVQRRIADGTLQTRKDDSGRVQVRLPEQTDTRKAVVQAVMQQSDNVVRMSESLSSSLATLLERQDRDRADMDATRRRQWRADMTAAVACVTAVALSAGLAWSILTASRQATDAAADQAVLQARYYDASAEAAALQQRLLDVSVAAADARHLSDALADADHVNLLLQADLEEARLHVAALQADLLLGRMASAGE